MKVFCTHVTVARPMGDNPGSVEPSYYTVDGEMVTLTEQEGVPIAWGRLQLGYLLSLLSLS
jgi:hypothetical protein